MLRRGGGCVVGFPPAPAAPKDLFAADRNTRLVVGGYDAETTRRPWLAASGLVLLDVEDDITAVGAGAAELARAARLGVVLMDIRTPVPDGVATIRQTANF